MPKSVEQIEKHLKARIEAARQAIEGSSNCYFEEQKDGTTIAMVCETSNQGDVQDGAMTVSTWWDMKTLYVELFG